MVLLWNCLSLDRPPTATWRPKNKEFDIPAFLSVINQIMKDLSYQETLHTEAAILSRLIYRMKWKFRSDKGLKNMEKTNRALLNYLKLSIENEIIYLKGNVDATAVPSRQILEYVLVGIQGFAKLMCRVEDVAKIAAQFLKARISIGQAWLVTTIAFSVVSRIWLMSRHLVKMSCRWYNNLYPFLEKMELVGVKWMPEDQSLPFDLKKWIDVPWIDEPIQCVAKEETAASIFRLIKVNDDDDVVVEDFVEPEEVEMETAESKLSSTKLEKEEDLSEDVEMKSEIKKTDSNVKNVIKNHEIKRNNLHSTADVGEKISRDSFKPQEKRQKIECKKVNSKPKLNTIKSKEDITELLKLDSYPGLDRLQWRMLKNTMTKTLIKLEKLPSNSPKHELLLGKLVRSLRDYVR